MNKDNSDLNFHTGSSSVEMNSRFDVFLSHHSGDKAWVLRLKNELVGRGLRVWLDRDEIRLGDLFVEALERGIEESHETS